MKSRRRNLSEDRRITSRRDKRSKISVNGREENSESIPIDLVMEILSRLSAKSIAKCRCVSKLWSSLLRRPDFTELFLTRSRSRPQLLFACQKHRELFFYSSPQLQIHDENSSTIIPSYLMKSPLIHEYGQVSHSNGLVILRDEFKERNNIVKVLVLCNPSTGKSLVLSKKTERFNFRFSCLGYDPIEKQFKVLSISINSASSPEYQVMTLGTRKMLWRKVECGILLHPGCNAICVNGVLYFPALSSRGVILVCFDIRSEKFSFLNFGDNITAPMHDRATLINYNGKLRLLVSDGPGFSGRCRSFVLWNLEDTEKQEWSKHIYVLPPLWESVVGDISLKFVGVIGANQFVFSSSYGHSPFCLFYYNIERNTIRKVEILGLEVSETHNNVYTFLNHVEDIKPIDSFKAEI